MQLDGGDAIADTMANVLCYGGACSSASVGTLTLTLNPNFNPNPNPSPSPNYGGACSSASVGSRDALSSPWSGFGLELGLRFGLEFGLRFRLGVVLPLPLRLTTLTVGASSSALSALSFLGFCAP